MYELDIKHFGILITFDGITKLDEAIRLQEDLDELMSMQEKPFSVISDARKLVAPSKEILDIFIKIQQNVLNNKNIIRTATIICSPVVKSQVTQLAYNSKLINIDRQINAAVLADWEDQAINWVVNGIEPIEKKPIKAI